MKQMTLHEETHEDVLMGLQSFNRYVHEYCSNGNLLQIRLNALNALAQDKANLHNLALYFKRIKPHWWFLNGDDYTTCKYVIYRLSNSEEEFYRNPWGDKYFKVRINVNPDKHAYVRRKYMKKTGSCMIHPDQKDHSQGLCRLCYNRYYVLRQRGLITHQTPETVVQEILAIPKCRRGELIHQVTKILSRGMN